MSPDRIRRGRALSRTVFPIACAAFLLLFAPALPAQQKPAAPKTASAQDALPAARAIIERHIKAIGGRTAVQGHTSTHIKGTIAIPANGVSGTVEVFAAKPNKALVRMDIAGIGEALEGFDGEVAWSVTRLTGPMVLQGKELEQKKFDADYYGELNADARYASMKTLEKTTWEGRPSYKVSLTRRDGSEEIEYYDVETGFKTGRVITRETMVGALPMTQVAADYRRFGDLMHPATTKQTVMAVQQVITITSVEYDKVDPAVFEPPASIRALIKQ